MQADPVGQRDHLVARDRDLRAQRVVRRVGVGHDGVEPVVAALQFDQHEEPAIAVGCPARPRRRGPRRRTRRPGTRRRGTRTARRRSGETRGDSSSIVLAERADGGCPSRALTGRYLSWYAGSRSAARTNATASVSGRGGSAATGGSGSSSCCADSIFADGVSPGRRATHCAASKSRLRRPASTRCAKRRARALSSSSAPVRCGVAFVGGLHVGALAGARGRTPDGGRGRHRHHRRGCAVHAHDAVEELLAREQRVAVDPRVAAGPALHVRRGEEVLAHAGRGDGERHRLRGRELELPQRADDELDRTLHEGARAGRPPRTRR